jgi:small conductance mechanosensitive channel
MGIAASLDGTANLLARRGFETAQYRQIVIRTTGEVTEDILNPKVLLGLLRELGTDLGRWLRDKGPTILVRLLIIIGVIVLFRIGFRLAWWLFRILRLVKFSQLLTNLVGGLVRPIASLAGLVTGLWIVGLNPTTLLAGLGVAGIIVGLALQDSLSNLAAGFFILTNRPYDVGDVIEAGGVVGTVQAMGLANTTIMTFDNRRLFVPNQKIWSDVIENRSAEPIRRVEVTVKISYREDLDRALGVLRNILDVNEKVLEEPEPAIFISKLADSWIEVAIWPWTKNEHWLDLLRELPRLVRLRFEEEGIEVPYPRREIVADRSKDMPPTEESRDQPG